MTIIHHKFAPTRAHSLMSGTNKKRKAPAAATGTDRLKVRYTRLQPHTNTHIPCAAWTDPAPSVLHHHPPSVTSRATQCHVFFPASAAQPSTGRPARPARESPVSPHPNPLPLRNPVERTATQSNARLPRRGCSRGHAGT